MTYADMVRPYEKSVVLGGAIVLFPIDPALTQGFATQIRMAIERAEDAAFRAGYEKARSDIRKSLGMK